MTNEVKVAETWIDPIEALQWALEFAIPDLHRSASAIERAAKSEADYLRGKASLLEDIINSALLANSEKVK